MDTANLKKTLDAGKRQSEEIKLIDEKLGINNISNKKARLLAILRLQNESASLVELATMMSEQLDKEITKSNINHMFRYIHDLYTKLNV